MKPLIALLALGLSALWAPAAIAAEGAPATQCQARAAPDPRLQAMVDPVVDDALANGFAGGVAIMRDGAIVYQRVAGTADSAGVVPVTDRTLFQVASLTKYFTAVMVLRAVEDHRLSLDDRVAVLFPGTELVAPTVTVRDLLMHRSGLGSSYAAEQTRDSDTAVRAIDAVVYEPERAGIFHYSNDGFDLLAILLERSYGRRYEDVFREIISTPACLSNVGFWGESAVEDPAVRAQPLVPLSENLRGRNYGMIGSAGLLINAADLVQFQYALRNGWVIGADALVELDAPRGEVSVGQAAFGHFISRSETLGEFSSARGSEDWGDNAYLNDYRDCGLTLAIVTSRGPAEGSGTELFRDSISKKLEALLPSFCTPPR